MGALAHYVVVGELGVELRVSSFGAVSLLRDMFWGPEHGLRFAQEQASTDRWRLESMCEGVACIDTVQRTLVVQSLYGCGLPLPVRRVYLAMLTATWPGWSVRWAPRGLFDVLEHVCLDPEIVRDSPGADPLPADWDLAADDSINTVVSVRTEAGELFFYGAGNSALLPDLLEVGPDGVLAGALRRPELAPTVFPMSGLHLDLGRRAGGYWTADTLGHPVDDPEWPGWMLTCWYDRYEEQLARTDRALKLPEPVAAEQIRQFLNQGDQPAVRDEMLAKAWAVLE